VLASLAAGAVDSLRISATHCAHESMMISREELTRPRDSVSDAISEGRIDVDVGIPAAMSEQVFRRPVRSHQTRRRVCVRSEEIVSEFVGKGTS